MTMVYLWAAVRPVLTYGSHCIYLRVSAIEKMQKLQAKLVKQSLGLHKYCRNSAMLDALACLALRAWSPLPESGH